MSGPNMNIKLDIHKNSDIIRRKDSVNNWNVQNQVKKDVIDFINDLAIGKVNKGKPASERTQVKYIDLLKIPLSYINKNNSSITIKDIEKFERALTSGELSCNKRKPYAHSTKVGIRVSLKVFLIWKLGTEKAIKLTELLDTREKEKTPDFLKENEIEKLYDACKTAHERFIIAVIFDSGARAEEFLNIRYEDIELPEGNNNFVKITLKSEYSKTQGRTISLYWDNSFKAVRDYLKEREIDGIKSDEPVFNFSYDAGRFLLKRLGVKILGKNLNYHLFRHSSATYYANKLNRQELCYRYGWRFSSNMPDIYISRSGMENNGLEKNLPTQN